MLKYNKNEDGVTTTLNDIPPSTIFTGEITGSTGHVYHGPFLRIAEGKYNMPDGTSITNPVFAVSLTETVPRFPHNPATFMRCTEVRNYRVLRNPEIVER